MSRWRIPDLTVSRDGCVGGPGRSIGHPGTLRHRRSGWCGSSTSPA